MFSVNTFVICWKTKMKLTKFGSDGVCKFWHEPLKSVFWKKLEIEATNI